MPLQSRLTVRTPAVNKARAAAIIPVYNEAAAIASVLAETPRDLVSELIVVDGGSHDGTQAVARAAGATVIQQRGSGYGDACLSGALHTDAELLVFLDGDYSDPPAAIPSLLAPLRSGRADLVLGARTAQMQPGALPLHAQLGNRLAVVLLRRLFGIHITDLPSFKAIRRQDLLALAIKDTRYGWTAELIARSAARGLRIEEAPIAYRLRIGRSKVSGSLSSSLRAGFAILRAILRVRFVP